ncbi:hypothetical protein J6590_041932 [Homalodisca vitripennis]|nr:hypothetical protein J6590_041932 [Homalodisca vitripennis]
MIHYQSLYPVDTFHGEGGDSPCQALIRRWALSLAEFHHTKLCITCKLGPPTRQAYIINESGAVSPPHRRPPSCINLCRVRLVLSSRGNSRKQRFTFLETTLKPCRHPVPWIWFNPISA